MSCSVHGSLSCPSFHGETVFFVIRYVSVIINSVVVWTSTLMLARNLGFCGVCTSVGVDVAYFTIFFQSSGLTLTDGLFLFLIWRALNCPSKFLVSAFSIRPSGAITSTHDCCWIVLTLWYVRSRLRSKRRSHLQLRVLPRVWVQNHFLLDVLTFVSSLLTFCLEWTMEVWSTFRVRAVVFSCRSPGWTRTMFFVT